MAYTNHTLLPEAPSVGRSKVFKAWLPPLSSDIIFTKSTHQHLAQVAPAGGDTKTGACRLSRRAPEPQIRMAYLAIVGSMSVNAGGGTSFQNSWPKACSRILPILAGKIQQQTNGVTQRRWLAGIAIRDCANWFESIGDGWISDLEQIKRIAPLAKTRIPFRRRSSLRIKAAEQKRLAALVEKERCPKDIFDVRVKRIHEYKRHLLNVLHVCPSL